MKLLSVNVSLPKTVEVRGKQVSTSIFKEPTTERIHVRRLSLEGDRQERARQALRCQTLGPEWREPLEERLLRAEE
jgi:MOSC domain-containing protein YiiM